MSPVTGRVKWFNSRAGYGFITIVSNESKGEDIFVHHSSLRCQSEQYKYLIQGEYVEFVLTETNDSQHKFQADNVIGIMGGNLMCETRNQMNKRTPGATNNGGRTRTTRTKEAELQG
tara:strand:- start:2201 stop:2551 length:351 start_codon:yes stop_codon:yes gene_type:complete